MQLFLVLHSYMFNPQKGLHAHRIFVCGIRLTPHQNSRSNLQKNCTGSAELTFVGGGGKLNFMDKP